jgi:prepilin-type N-terminal cleavage/methylation domain-containing protein
MKISTAHLRPPRSHTTHSHTPQPRTPQPYTTRSRAFTLIEVVTVTAISSILILVTVAWVVSLLGASAAGVSQSGNTTAAAFVTSRLTTDLRQAVDCSGYGLDTPFYSFSPTQIAFYSAVGSRTTTLSGASSNTATTLSVGVSAGASTITVTSSSGLIVGSQLIVGDPNNVFDSVLISSITGTNVTLSSAVGHTYPSGTAVSAPGSSITLTSTSGITPGSVLTVGTGSTGEMVTVSYITGSTAVLVTPLQFSHLNGESVTFGGATSLVTWRVQGTTLQRAVITGSATCDPAAFASGYTSPTWVTVASGIVCSATVTSDGNCLTGTPNDPLYFSAYSGGIPAPGGTTSAPISCTGAGATACYFSSVGLTTSIVGSGNGGVVSSYANQFSVRLSGSRLGNGA